MSQPTETVRADRPAPKMPCACSAAGGCGGGLAVRPPAPSFATVRVNEVEIPQAAIAREMQHHPAADPESAWREAARSLAVRELLLQEARRSGIPCEPEVDANGRREADDDALVRALLERDVQPAAATEEECRRVYEANPRKFRTPDLFEASHILIEPQGAEASAWSLAESQARMIAAEIGNSRERFAAAARAFSKCPSARQDGSLGQIRRGELAPALQDALECLQPGTTSPEPIRSRFGWHVLRLERRIEGRQLPFEVVRPKIADMLEARAWMMASAHYIADLAKRAKIEGIDITPDAATRP